MSTFRIRGAGDATKGPVGFEEPLQSGPKLRARLLQSRLQNSGNGLLHLVALEPRHLKLTMGFFIFYCQPRRSKGSMWSRTVQLPTWIHPQGHDLIFAKPPPMTLTRWRNN